MLVALPVNNLIHYIPNTCETFRDLLKRQGWRIWLKFKIKRRSCVKRAHPLNKASIIYLWVFSIHGPLAYPHKYRRFILHYFIIYHFSFNPSIFPSKTTNLTTAASLANTLKKVVIFFYSYLDNYDITYA